MINLSSILVIIRSNDERTTSGCRLLLTQIFHNVVLHVINVTPFSQAIKVMFELALQEKKEWMLCIDADVLISEEGIKKLISGISTLDKNVFQLQGLVLDKFFNVYRPAGNHLYRIAFAEQAIAYIPEEGTSLRPETDMLNRMSKAGYTWVQCDAIVGIHDYEQYYSDIYRKCFLQAHKHDKVVEYLEKYWNDMSSEDTDFQVALWGSTSGKLYKNTVLVDKRFMEKEAIETLHIKKTNEKETIADISNLVLFVQQTIDNYYAINFETLQEKIFPKSLWNRTIDLKTSPNTVSLSKKVLHAIRSILVKFENKFKNIIKGK